MRSPTGLPGAQRTGGSRFGTHKELLRRHAMAAAENMDISGLERLHLLPAGGEEGGLDLVRSIKMRAQPGAAARKPMACQKIAGQHSAIEKSVTLCSPCQPGMLLTSMTVSRPSRRAQQIDAGEIRAHRLGCSQ